MKVVVGLGLTGVSCVEYLLAKGEEVIVLDDAPAPAGYTLLRDKYPKVRCLLGDIDKAVLAAAEAIIVSPGVPLEKVTVSKSRVPIMGDIELLARETKKPIYGITGSNGKTTVTTLVGEMAKAAGVPMAVAGNIGTPVLNFLHQERYKGYVLELSSFQLETTYSLAPRAATILNVTPDHLDRYPDFSAYLAAKQRIYSGCQTPIVNADEPWIFENLNLSDPLISFSVKHQKADYHLQSSEGRVFLCRRGQPLIAADQMLLQGTHHWQNALAALAFGEVMSLSQDAMVNVLKTFTGLKHRCQWVRSRSGVDWYNDSKATNVGATETAVNSLGPQTKGKLILLAGGLGKGADFSCLKPCVDRFVSDIILLGQDAPLLAKALASVASMHFVKTMQEAVLLADELAKPGDRVLLAPACASLDMFQNYEDRGNQFMLAVNALC